MDRLRVLPESIGRLAGLQTLEVVGHGFVLPERLG